MMRGTFANIRIRNRMLDDVEGGITRYAPTGETMPIYDAAMAYQARRHAAGRHRRQGIWHRQLARLGGQGHHPARRARGDRRELRAHPPLQPGRHGRAAAAVPRRRERRRASASTAARPSRSPASPASSRARTSKVEVTRADGDDVQLHRPLPHRYLQRARIFPLGRHPPLRAAEARGAVMDGELVGTCHCGRARITLAAQARRSHPLQLQPVHQDRLPGRLFLVRRAADRGRVRQLCAHAISNPAYIAQHRCTPLRHHRPTGRR